MDIIIATLIGSVIVWLLIWIFSKVPMDILFVVVVLTGLAIISFILGSLVLDLLNFTNFYKEI